MKVPFRGYSATKVLLNVFRAIIPKPIILDIRFTLKSVLRLRQATDYEISNVPIITIHKAKLVKTSITKCMLVRVWWSDNTFECPY
jgi:hypothetical protein